MSMNTGKQIDIWARWDWLWSALFYTAVLVAVVLTVTDDERSAPLGLTLLLTGGLLLWHSIGLKLTYKGMAKWDQDLKPRFVVILGDIAIWFMLAHRSPTYYFVLFGFGQLFFYLPIRYAAIALVFTTLAIIYEQFVDASGLITLDNPLIWLVLCFGFVAVIFAIWIAAIIRQSTRRRELIEALEQAQAELAAAERREGVLEERQRLAREIHDTLTQGFTSIVMHLEAADQSLPNDPVVLKRHLDQARSTARNSLDQARRVVQDLRPDLLEKLSLPDAIERTAQRWGEETGIAVSITTTGTPLPLHPDLEVTLLRASQEALNNIRKHAQATSTQLTLSYMSDMIILDVQDDGVGLGTVESTYLSGGYGLRAMRERAKQFGGAVELESEPGEGTTLVVTIPLVGSNENEA